MAHKTRIMYVECKGSGDHRGPARICRVQFSKSGRTIYLDGLALTPCSTTARLNGRSGPGTYGNYIDRRTQIEYWVSGPRKRGGDRHWAGGGQVSVDSEVVDEYWRDIRNQHPPKNPFIA